MSPPIQNSQVDEIGDSKPIDRPANNKRPYNKPPPKKWFGKRRNNDEQASNKRNKAEFTAVKSTATVLTFPLRPVFEYHTNIYGLKVLINIMFNILVSMDHNIARRLTEQELLYAAVLATVYRMALISNTCKVTVITADLSKLRQAVSGLTFPEPIVRYIESLGRTATKSGYDLIPYFRDYISMVGSESFLDPADVLTLMDLEPENLTWGINYTVLIRYQQNIARATRKSIELREVDNRNLLGKPEFLVSYRRRPNELQPYSFEEMDSHVAQLGACFMFRNKREIDDWDGMKIPQTFGAPEIVRDIFLNSWILSLMR